MSVRVRLFRPLARQARQHMPRLYWRAANGIALGRWLASAPFRRRSKVDTYDEAFWQWHDDGDWVGFAALIMEHFHPRSLADVGCGDGKLLAALRRGHPGVHTVGYDASPTALERARRSGATVHGANLAFARFRSCGDLAKRVCGYDVAVCLETAEHLPPWSARGLVHVLTRAPVVVFSSAQPLQGGELHMNEQPPGYWTARFELEGFDLHPSDGVFRAAVSGLDLPWWYARNIQVFQRRA